MAEEDGTLKDRMGNNGKGSAETAWKGAEMNGPDCNGQAEQEGFGKDRNGKERTGRNG